MKNTEPQAQLGQDVLVETEDGKKRGLVMGFLTEQRWVQNLGRNFLAVRNPIVEAPPVIEGIVVEIDGVRSARLNGFYRILA